MVAKAIKDLKQGLSLYHVWLHQAYHEISSKYKRTVLGSLWISGAMVATAMALSIVMGGIQGQNLHDVLPYVMAGIMCYYLPSYILADAPEVYMTASSIIRNHAYPYTYYSFESVTRVFIIFFHNIVAFYITMLLLQQIHFPDWTVIFALPMVYANAVIWGTLSSMLAARFRDMRFLLPFISQIVFFLTPVFWHPEKLTGWRSAIVRFNPIYGLLEIVRSPLLGHAAPLEAWELSGISLAVGAILWAVFFGAYRGKIAFWV